MCDIDLLVVNDWLYLVGFVEMSLIQWKYRYRVFPKKGVRNPRYPIVSYPFLGTPCRPCISSPWNQVLDNVRCHCSGVYDTCHGGSIELLYVHYTWYMYKYMPSSRSLQVQGQAKSKTKFKAKFKATQGQVQGHSRPSSKLPKAIFKVTKVQFKVTQHAQGIFKVIKVLVKCPNNVGWNERADVTDCNGLYRVSIPCSVQGNWTCRGQV